MFNQNKISTMRMIIFFLFGISYASIAPISGEFDIEQWFKKLQTNISKQLKNVKLSTYRMALVMATEKINIYLEQITKEKVAADKHLMELQTNKTNEDSPQDKPADQAKATTYKLAKNIKPTEEGPPPVRLSTIYEEDSPPLRLSYDSPDLMQLFYQRAMFFMQNPQRLPIIDGEVIVSNDTELNDQLALDLTMERLKEFVIKENNPTYYFRLQFYYDSFETFIKLYSELVNWYISKIEIIIARLQEVYSQSHDISDAFLLSFNESIISFYKKFAIKRQREGDIELKFNPDAQYLQPYPDEHWRAYALDLYENKTIDQSVTNEVLKGLEEKWGQLLEDLEAKWQQLEANNVLHYSTSLRDQLPEQGLSIGGPPEQTSS